MTILAQAILGQEYMYNPRTAHEVPKSSADKIAHFLNKHKFELADGRVWHVFNIDQYDLVAYDQASTQRFKIGRGRILRYRN